MPQCKAERPLGPHIHYCQGEDGHIGPHVFNLSKGDQQRGIYLSPDEAKQVREALEFCRDSGGHIGVAKTTAALTLLERSPIDRKAT